MSEALLDIARNYARTPSPSLTMLEALTRDYADLEKFSRAAWGKPGGVLKKSGHIEFIDLEPYPALRELFAGTVRYNKVLVREEYRTALKALETETYCFGAYVTGQPGIGKTLFLIYVLVARLERKLAVALQFPDGTPFYAIFHHTVSFHSLFHRSPLRSFPSLWALTDSNQFVQSPSGIFCGVPARIRVIQATSPKEIRWKEWSKQVGAEAYVMDIWSEKEIADLANLLGLDAPRMIDLGKNWGFVPRTILDFMRKNASDFEIEDEYKDLALKTITKFRDVINAVIRKALSNDIPSPVLFCRPASTNRWKSRADIPTRRIRYLLGEALYHVNNSIRADFYSVLRQSSDTSQAAGMLFEHWFHSFFLARKTIECNWVQGGEGTTQLTGPTILLRSVLNVLETAKPPYFWIAPKGFEGIDSVLVLEDEIYAFQITISSKHKPPTEGMLTVRKSLRGEVKKLPWRVLFVGDDEPVVSQLAGQWVDKIYFPTDKTSVPIAWSALDPVQPGVTYRDFEESDEMDVSK